VQNIAYKTTDHAFRSADAYAQGKYDITTRWLRPRARAGQRLLNVGCGGGEYNSVARSLGYDVTACEPEPQAYELAVQNSPSCRVIHSGLMTLDLQPAHAIVMHDVLEHIEDDIAAVQKVHELLAPGGVAVISVPAFQWLFGHHDVQLGHYRRYTRSSLLALVRERFVIEQARYYGAALIPVALWFSRITKKAYPTAAASRGLGYAAMRAICGIGARVPMPAGTSVIIRLSKS
jgi:2-polyprenyl-3-methyl-5-hydroxy-6-metoxy-1,4-benzoquinol methylase